MTHLIPLDEPLITCEWDTVRLRQHFRHPRHPERSYRLSVGDGASPHVRALSQDAPSPLHLAYLCPEESALSGISGPSRANGRPSWSETWQPRVREALLQDRGALLRQTELLLGLIDPDPPTPEQDTPTERLNVELAGNVTVLWPQGHPRQGEAWAQAVKAALCVQDLVSERHVQLLV